MPAREGTLRSDVVRLVNIEDDPGTAHLRFDTPGYEEPFRPHLIQEGVSHPPIGPVRYSVGLYGPYGDFQPRSGNLPPKERRMVFFNDDRFPNKDPNGNLADIPPELAAHLLGPDGLLALQRTARDIGEPPSRWGQSSDPEVPPPRQAPAPAGSPEPEDDAVAGDDGAHFSCSTERRLDVSRNREITAMRVHTRSGTIQPVHLDEVLTYEPNSGTPLSYRTGIYAPDEPLSSPELGGTFTRKVQYGDGADHPMREMPAALAALLIGPDGMLARLPPPGSYSSIERRDRRRRGKPRGSMESAK